MDLTPEKPATGILKMNDWGSAMLYQAVCECRDQECTHTIDIEADDHEVMVTVYSKTKTNWWSKNRWNHIWQLLTKGYIQTESTIVMKQQAALNYCETIKSAIQDVARFRKERYPEK